MAEIRVGLISDWTVVSASLFALVGHALWRIESRKWSPGILCAQLAAIVAVAVGYGVLGLKQKESL